MALQRGFFTAKPTPNFWKKVSKLIAYFLLTPHDCIYHFKSEGQCFQMRATMLFVLSAGRMCPPAIPRHCRWLFLKVPAKSAQDCFDKVNSDHMTLPQTFPLSRAKRINSSPLECFSISVSKLLNPSGPKNKRLSCKQKSHLAHKNVRELLQKQNQVNRDYEANLFSILEPKQNSSMQDSNWLLKFQPLSIHKKNWVFFTNSMIVPLTIEGPF